MSTLDKQQEIQTELLGATLRYCAVADWFESFSCAWHKQMSVCQAMAIFTRAETELRAAGARALRHSGHRDLLLQAAVVPKEAR